MATFESKASPGSTCQEVQKFPIRRLEPTIQKFLKIIQIDIDRLHKHRTNVQKYSRLGDWPSLHKENINATRTVQQVKANIREIDKTRKQINDEDLEEFDKKTESMKRDALQAIQDFIGSVETDMTQAGSRSMTDDDDLLTSPLMSRSSSDSMNLSLHQTQITEPPQNTEALESWENLHENLVELNTMIHEFATAVQGQQESIDRIEDNIEKAHENVRSGVTHLGKAAKYKAAILPIAGALIGTAVGGPIGFVAGLKIGGAAALGGGVIGFAGGKLLKKRQDKVTDLELKNLSEKRSCSLPDISCKDDAKSSWLPWKS